MTYEHTHTTASPRRHLRLASVVGLLLFTGCGDMCDPPPPPGDGGTEATLEWTAPRNDNTLFREADDLDGDAEGIQISVRLSYTGTDTELTLTVDNDGDTETYTATVSGNTVEFDDVTIPHSGDEENPAASTLTVSASDVDEDAVRNVLGFLDDDPPPEPSCVFNVPQAGDTIEDDNPGLAGFQINTTVHCINVSPGTDVEVFVVGSDVGTGTLDAALTAQVVIGTDTPTEPTAAVLTVRASGLPNSASTINVTLDPGNVVLCDATITAPSTGDMFGAGSADADPATPGFQVDVEVSTDPSCANGDVEVSDGTNTETATLDPQGNGVVTFTLANGASTLTATASLNGTTGTSDSVDVTYTEPAFSGINFVIADAATCAHGDSCINAAVADADTNSGTFEADITVVVAAIGGACPFNAADLSVGGTALANTVAYVLNGTDCEAAFGPVTVHADGNIDETTIVLESNITSGGTSQLASHDLVIDRVAPSVTWFDSNNDVLNIADDQQAGGDVDYLILATATGMTGATLQYVEQGVGNVGTPCNLTMSPERCDLSMTHADGTFTVEATGADRNGNPMAANSLTLTFDGTRPCVESFSLDRAGGDLSVDASEGSTQTLTVTFGADCAIEDGQTVTVTSSLSGAFPTATTSSNTAVFTDLNFIDGTHTLTVAAADAAGNDVDTGSNTGTVEVDTSAPTCVIAAPTATTLLVADDLEPGTPDLQVDFQVTSDGDSAVFTIDAVDGGSEAVSGGALTSRKTLTQGGHTISVTCSDAIGNATTTADYVVDVDSVGPTVAFDNPPAAIGSADDTDGGAPGVQTTLAIAYTDVDPGQTIEIYAADGAGQPTGAPIGTFTAAVANGTVNIDVSFLGDCSGCRFVATASDDSGNTAVSAVVTIDITTGTYAGTFVTPDGANDPLAINLAIDGNAGDGAQVAVVVNTTAPDGSDAMLYINGTLIETVTVSSGTATFSSTTVSPATGTMEVTFFNSGTSVAGTTGVRNYVVDQDAPTIAWVTPDAADAPIAFTFNADATPANVAANDNNAAAGYQQSATLNVQGCGGEALTITSGATNVLAVAVTVATDNEPTQTVSLSIPDGAGQTLTASCTDAAGNTGTADLDGDVDTVPPATPSTFAATVTDHARGNINLDWEVPGDDGLVGAATLTSFFMLDQGEVNDVNFDTMLASGTDLGLTGTAGDTPTTALTGFFFHNTYRLAMRATDDLGNVSGVASATFTPDLASHSLTQADDGNDADLYGSVLNVTRGDLDNDGRNDLVFGAPGRGASCFLGFCEGEIHILYGEADTATLQAASPQTLSGTGFGGGLGYDLDIVRSLDGDAIDDLLVNVYETNEDVEFFAGADNTTISDSSAKWTTGTFDQNDGSPVTGIGDINNDGNQDFIVGKYNGTIQRRFELVFGDGAAPAASQNYSANTLKNVELLSPNVNGQGASTAVALGDLNGDGVDDFAVGFTDVSTGANSEIYVVLGRDESAGAPGSEWGNDTAEQSLDVTVAAGFTALPATNTSAQKMGAQLSAGDINGDGDIDIVGAANNRAFVWFGNGDGTFNEGFLITSDGFSSKVQRTGLVAGDLNGDGYDDIVVRGDQGVNVYFGSDSTANRTTPDSAFSLGSSQAGYTLGAPGDLNGDGLDDIVVGLGTANTVWILTGP